MSFHTEDVAFQGQFSDLYLSDATVAGLKYCNFLHPSPIQYSAIPVGLTGQDLIAQAKSGTGKTCTFAVIILEKIKLEVQNVQAMCIAPTREIAIQLRDSIAMLGKFREVTVAAFIGGMPIAMDKSVLKHACHVVCGTPGRLLQLLENQILNISSLDMVVIDEADRMFAQDVVLEACVSIMDIVNKSRENRKIQIMAFSATFTVDIVNTIEKYMKNPASIRLCANNPTLEGVLQYYCIVPQEQTFGESLTQGALKYANFVSKTKILLNLLSSLPFYQCIVFSNNRTRAAEVATILLASSFSTGCIAGDMEQTERNAVIKSFRENNCRVLISTDVTSRGLDLPNISLVIHMDVPWDAETYLHRVGRTGRFGTLGVSVAIVDENELLKIQDYAQSFGCTLSVLSSQVPSMYFSGSAQNIVSAESIKKLREMDVQADGSGSKVDPTMFDREMLEKELVDENWVNEDSFDGFDSTEETNQCGVYCKKWGFFVENGYYENGILHDLNGWYDEEGYYHKNNDADVPGCSLEENSNTAESVDVISDEIKSCLNFEAPLLIETAPQSNLVVSESEHPSLYYNMPDLLRSLALKHATRHHSIYGYPQ